MSPLFVSETLVGPVLFVEPFNDLNAWAPMQGSWWLVGGGALQNDADLNEDWIRHDQEGGTLDLFFSYRRDIAEPQPPTWKSQVNVFFRWNDEGTVERRAGYSFRENRFNLWQDIDGTQVSFVETDLLTSTLGEWYDVHIRAEGRETAVWWGLKDQPLELILTTDQFDVLGSHQVVFSVMKDGQYSFDDVTLVTDGNQGEYLHLRPDSPCLDAGDTPADPEQSQNPEKFRDFDNQWGPIDFDGQITTSGNLFPEERDIGADEFPNPQASTFWWRNF